MRFLALLNKWWLFGFPSFFINLHLKLDGAVYLYSLSDKLLLPQFLVSGINSDITLF